MVQVHEGDLTGVLIVNSGTPDEASPEAVKRFLISMLSDRHLIQVNRLLWWFILHLFIAPKRSKVVAQKYAQIWTSEGSPLKCIQDSLALKLEANLRANHYNVVVESAYNYSSPDIPTAVGSLRDKGCTRIILLPLYPQSAFSTTTSVIDSFHQALEKLKWEPPYEIIENYYNNEVYLNALVETIRQAGFDQSAGDTLLVSFHAIPHTDVMAGDTYEKQSYATANGLARKLQLSEGDWFMGYQSNFGKAEDWSGPLSENLLAPIAKKTKGRLFYICPGFSIDCLETYFDVLQESKTQYLNARAKVRGESNDGDFIYISSLGEDSKHVKVLTNVLEPYMERSASCLNRQRSQRVRQLSYSA
ncbi:MAG: ferrochelatase [Eggerthellaceae bacterium]|jgi:ferrochelatase